MKPYLPMLRPVRAAEWNFVGAKYLFLHPFERRLIAENQDLHGLHTGARCFIIGNGPSLADEDLSLLDGEIIITLNNLAAGRIGAPNPKYHVISDRRFFSVDPSKPSDRDVFDTLWDIFSGDPILGRDVPTVFAPTSEHGFFDRFGVERPHCVRYFCNPFYFSDYYIMSSDLTGIFPRFSSVMQHAILISVALGFEQIYLLGADTTNIVANVNTALSASAAESYGYEVSATLDRWFQDQFAKRSMERCAESYLEVLVAFRFLASFCRDRGVELVNCSSRTVVDSIQRARLRDIL